MPGFLTLQEVADYLRVNTKTIYRLLEKGKIPAIKLGRQWRFNKSAIDKWINEKAVGVSANILVVDDEDIIRDLFKNTLEDLGHTVYCADTAETGLEIFKQNNCDLVFLDLKMRGMDGAELFRHIKMLKPRVSVIIITAYPDSDIMSRALAQGPFSVMSKPFSESDIIACVNSFLRV